MRAYANYGEVEVVAQTPFSALIQLHLDPCSAGFWAGLGGGLRAVLEHAGAERVRVETQRGSQLQACRYALRWS